MRATDAALLIVALVILWSFYRAQRNPDFHFDLFDLLMEGGKVSRLAFAFMTSLGVTSFIMFRLTMDGKMTEMMFAAYGTMWVVPICAKLFAPAPAASTSTQTISTQTVTTP